MARRIQNMTSITETFVGGAVSLKETECGYCHRCNKEIPIVDGVLEPHWIDGNYSDCYSPMGPGNGLCEGSKCLPSRMPKSGVNRKFSFRED